jgi:ectoine hydroxylase-related dioxygenase (phytanoyl-CoA dioxygenase family)
VSIHWRCWLLPAERKTFFNDAMPIPQSDRDIYCLRSAGYAVFPQFLDSERTDALRNELQAFEAEVRRYAQRKGGVDFVHGWPLLTTRCLYCVSETVQDIAMDARIQAVAHRYLGGAVIRDCLLQTNMPDPNSRQRSVHGRLSFHRDTLWKDGPIEPSYLHAFILLTDFTFRNGATCVVPGSNHEREPGYYFKHNDVGIREEGINYLVWDPGYFPSMTPILAPKGSLVFLDPMTIHSQGLNQTRGKRVLLNITFRRHDIAGNPPLLNAARIAREAARVPVRPDFLAQLESNPDLPAHFGPLGTPPARQPQATEAKWEKVFA